MLKWYLLPGNNVYWTIPSGQQFRLFLQEPTVAERGGAQKEGDDEADDGEEEGDAEDSANVDTCQDCWRGGQEDKSKFHTIIISLLRGTLLTLFFPL